MSEFAPHWRYNPIKRQLQFWISPTQGLAFESSLLKELEKEPLVPAGFVDTMQIMQANEVRQEKIPLGGWRNCSHEALIKLPISTR